MNLRINRYVRVCVCVHLIGDVPICMYVLCMFWKYKSRAKNRVQKEEREFAHETRAEFN